MVTWELLVAPYLAKLQREAEEKYRKVLAQEIQAYYDTRVAARIEDEIRRRGNMIKMLESEEKQPYVNIELTLYFDLSLMKRIISGPCRPDSILQLNFCNAEPGEVRISDRPVRQ